jgi:ATP-dependent DNA helicase RecQ
MIASPDRETARSALVEAFGPAAEFRDGQWEAIEPILNAGARELVVQRTGWGKSLVYFLATRLLRSQGSGPTLLVSPLLSLMRNQSELASRFKLNALSIDSTNRDDWSTVEHELANDRIDLLLVSPERLGNPDFKARLLPDLERRTRLLVIDEAHCISDWGHDFRPDYRRILESVARLNPASSILATTATANDRVIEDIRKQLGAGLRVQRGPLMRESLRLRVQILSDQAERLAWLAQFLPRLAGSGIVYTLTVQDAKRVAEWLQAQGIDAQAYYADIPTEERVAIEGRFQRNEVKVLVATTALGMGYDKADVAFIVHFQRPGSVISYYQQIGRAGRALDRAEVVLLEGSEDDQITQYFIDSAFPGSEVFESVRPLLRSTTMPTLDAITAKTNLRRGKVEKALKLLEVEGAVVHEKEGYRWIKPDWHYNELRSEEITRQRMQELEQMREFARTRTCRMEFLARALDDLDARPCGKCDNCADLKHPGPNRELVLAAMKFLQHDQHPIKPPGFFPPGFADPERRKKISESDRHEPGIALSVYNDAGWGRLVREGKYAGTEFSDELLDPSVEAIESLESKLDWVAWVPSMRSEIVARFAQKLADRLGIPAVEAIKKVKPNEEQKLMQNSTRQLQNVWDAFEVDQVRPGTCLLFDDIVDSGWTLQALAMKLRRAGAGKVVPFTLATARPRTDS